MRKFMALSLFFLPILMVAQQHYQPEKVSKKNRILYDKAMAAAEDIRYMDALNLLQLALDNDARFLEAQLSKAGILGELKRYPEAIDAYKKALDLDHDYAREYLLPYSINLAGAGRFEEAMEAIDGFLGIPGLNESSIKAATFRKKNLAFALERKQQDSVSLPLQVINMGDHINSEQSEYYPSITIDGKRLVVTRMLSPVNEDFYVSENLNGIWQASQPLQGDINTPMKEGAQQISQDGKWLVFAGQYPDSYGRFDIYLSMLTPNGWSERINMGDRINTEFWESSPCLSPDKSELYFASNRPGGFGGIDIYVSRRMANGRWSEPENLGPAINTAGDESCPFLHADNETLYFTSNGLQGYGGTDIFLVKRTPTGFSIPFNLGYPINTIDNEGGFFVAAAGTTAYYASDRSDSRGGLDIYAFELHQGVRPNPTTWVQGRVYDSTTGGGLKAVVELVDLKTKRVISQVETDGQGNYLSILPFGRTYAFSVDRKGYLFHSGRFELPLRFDSVHYEVNIPLSPFTLGVSMVLKNIQFETGKFNLLPESVVELDRVFSLLKENPAISIEISGHTDNAGKESDNQSLSANRAKAVVDYLIGKGIAPTRLRSAGFGASRPLADNATEAGRMLNRRTEMTIITGK